MCNVVGTLFQLGKLDLSYCTLSLNEINTIIFILERSPTTYWSELNLSHCNIGDAGCQHLYKGLSTLNHKVYFDEINVDNNWLSLESLQHLVMLLVQCKTLKVYATNNIITMDNSKIAYLAMEYAFAVKAISNPLSVIVNRQERAIFCQSENNTIIKYLNFRQMISGLYYNNCHLNDEVIGLLTDLIIKYEMITNLYFWNSNISEDYLKRILSVMPQGNHYQLVFVYEALEDDKSIVEMMLSVFIPFTFIFLSKVSLILFNASYSHITHLIFANPMLPETTLIETICLSQCELSDEIINLLIQLFNQCNNISTLMLLNNTFSRINLKRLMLTIKSKHLLRTIFVYQNYMTFLEMNSLENQFKNIQMLLINKIELRVYNCCDKQLKHISQLQIFLSPTVHKLQLCYCDIKDNALTYLYKLFQHCDHLREITIYYCLVDLHIVNKLLQHISTVTTLRKLNLRGNKLNEKSSQALASVIANNSKIKELYLGTNNLQSGVIKIAKALKKLSSLKVLDLDNNNIPEEAADELSAAIRANNSLKKLWLSGNYLGSSIVMIVNDLKQFTTLKELDLNGNQNRSEELAPALTSIISHNKSMDSLLLSDNNLNDDGVIKIAQSLCKHTKLKAIDLQSNNITEKAAEALASIISSNTRLEELYLGDNTIQIGVITMSTGFKNISSLKVLDLNDNNIPEEAADELSATIRANNSLEELWLGGNHLGSSTVMIVNALMQVTTLKVLNLNDNQNRSEELAPALTSIISHNKSMESLLLSDNNLNDDGVIKIAQSLCKHNTLKVINLQSNNITEKAAEALASIISSNTGLEELYLGNNTIQLGIITMSTALKNISSLKVLDLYSNNIPEEAADELSAAIKANNSLEKLSLGGNHLGSSTVMVVNALKQFTTLKELDLIDNQNRSEELAPALTSIISHNKCMESLLLSGNNLNDDGIIKIAQSLCKHNKLKMINLRSNNITEKAAEALASIISSNTGLIKLYLGNNKIQLGVITISTALTNISSLKVLDLENNNIPKEAADELSAAIRVNNSLEKLWLDGNHLGSSTVMIVNALKQVTTLKELSLNDNQNRGEELAPALTSIISHNKSIEILLLNDNYLNDDGVIKIAQALCKHTKLKMIDLRGNNITERSAEALASIISSNTGLEELYLGNNQIQLGVITMSTALKNISSLKVLDLFNNNIPGEGADELSAAIRSNSSLEKLSLNDNILSASMAVIGKACCHNSSLKELNFRNVGILVAAANDIAGVITFNSSIQLLSMSDNNLQSSGFMVIANALKDISSLKSLYAYGINVTSTVSEELSSVIEHNLSLENLSLGDNLLKNGLIKIMESCSRLTSLKILELSHNCISPTQVVNIASTVSKCNSLEALSMGGICLSVDESLYLNVTRIFEINMFVTEIKSTLNIKKQVCNYKFCIYSELLRMIFCRASLLNYHRFYVMYQYDFTYISYQHKNKFYENKVDCKPVLQEAKQKLSQINSKAMISSLQIIRTLKLINLGNNNIDEDAATELAGHLHCNNILEQLWLRGNELYDKGASVVLQSLHNLSTLLILDLSYNHLSSESADGIAVVVGNNCSLQQLWLDGNELLTRGVVRIASALKKLSSLRILSLCSNGITDDAAEEISNVITNNTLLVDLLLGNNQLESKGPCTIAVAIRKLFILRKLDLSNNHITPDATEGLAVTLSNCTGLQQLFLNDNMLGTEGTIKITNALKCINTLQVLTLSNNNITESAADVLVYVLRNNISLKILLISGNDLQTIGVNLIAQTAAKNITTLQLLDVSNNNIREDEKKNIKMIFANYNNFTIIV